MFKDNLKGYYEHFVKNPKSLIAKILGVYTIQFDVEANPQIVILMENIAKLDKTCIFNTYDIKGSTHARKVIKEKDRIQLISSFSVGKTLKDEDFKAKEKAMVVSTSVKKALLE